MFLKGGRIIIGNEYVVRLLKKKGLLPMNVADDILLPPDPDRRLIFVRKEHVNQVIFQVSCNANITTERKMNYSQMTEAVREGAQARRPTWKPNEKVWSDGKILIHNTPYFGEPFNQAIQGYAYVVEQVDVFAEDWELCAC